jgi:hypothetical protein
MWSKWLSYRKSFSQNCCLHIRYGSRKEKQNLFYILCYLLEIILKFWRFEEQQILLPNLAVCVLSQSVVLRELVNKFAKMEKNVERNEKPRKKPHAGIDLPINLTYFLGYVGINLGFLQLVMYH